MTYVQAVLFDLGNTLTVTASLAESLVYADLSSLGDELQLDQSQRLILGQRLEQHIERLYADHKLLQPHWCDVWQTATIDCGFNLETDDVERLCRAHLAAFVSRCRLQSYALPLLTALRRANISLGLISNVTGPVDIFAADLQAKGLAPFFRVVVWSSAVGYRKPHPRIFQTALNSLRLNAGEHVIMVGDHEQADIRGAKAMGFATVRVIPPGMTSADSEADYVSDGADLLDRIQAMLDISLKTTAC
jgi:putative hydrolase of the HAD superfamily